VDGEIVFAQGQALAWRELLQLRQGQVSQALVKERFRLHLVDWAGLCALAAAPAEQVNGPVAGGAQAAALLA
jgi:hypothetical protein